MDERTYSCIAQISGASGVKGAGFLVPGGHVVTCAHVVNQALGRVSQETEQPAAAEHVCITFPWSRDGSAAFVGRVVAWCPLGLTRSGDGVDDIAVLELEPAPPVDLRPAWLQILNLVTDVRVRTAGFPAGYTLDRHAQGRLVGADGAGWLQAVSTPDDMTFLPGHSGAPVFLDQGEAVVAMVAMTDDSRRDVALLIPTTILRRVWPTLGSPTPGILARNPYRGLQPFRAEHRDAFYGRDDYIAHVNHKLDQRRIVAIIGASGSGKSSLALAGVLPRRGDQGWLTADFRPRGDPFRELAAGLMSHLEPDVTAPGPTWEAAGRYSVRFRQSAGELVSLTRLVLDRTRRPALLILADQFEELFTQTEPQDREAFIALLAGWCGQVQSPIRWLLTLRADFMEEVLRDTRLTQLLQDADVKLGPMDEQQLGEAIVLPAKAQGVQLAPGLVERLIKDAISPPSNSAQAVTSGRISVDQARSRHAGRLPLLEFALDQLWHRQQGGEISHAAYDDQELGIGGIDGALRRHAQAVYQEFGSGPEGATRQARVRYLFRRLIQRQQGGDDVRRVVPKSEVEEDWSDLVVELARQRRVTTSESVPGNATVEVVHEELLRAWPELQQWVRENREFDTWREELTQDARRWRDADEGNKEDLLLRGAQLDKALVYLQEQGSQLNPAERDLLTLAVPCGVSPRPKKRPATAQS